MKLSKAQLRVLGLMPIHKARWPGPDGPSFYKKGECGYPASEVPINTYYVLLKKGLIKETKTAQAYPDTWEVTLTPAGLEALAEAGGGRGKV